MATAAINAMLGAHASGAFSPTALPGLTVWIDPSNAGSITSSGGLASQINDLSGNGFHLTATGTAKPSTGSRSQNSLNVLDFDGSANVMTNTSFSFATATATLYVVGCFDTGSGGGRLTSLRKYPANDDWDNTTGVSWATANDGGAYYNNNPATSGGSFGTSAFLYTVIRNGTAWTARKDRSAITGSTSVATAFDPDRISIGANPAGASPNNFLNGFVAEMILCSSAHGTTDRDNAETYLRTKWGTP